jgi:hypothetical protein
MWAAVLAASCALTSSAACDGNSNTAPPLVVAPDRLDTLSQQPRPGTLDETFEALSRGLSGADFHAFQVLGEGDAMAATHGTSEFVRRHWIEAADGRLRGELRRAGLEADDMGEAVFRTFWRRLHDRPIDLAGQVQHFRVARAVPSPDRAVVFPGEAARSLVEQCNRREPGPVTGVWTPDAATITRLEAALGPALQKALDERAPRDVNYRAPEYYRQYGGLVIDGRRIVYVNGFHWRFISLTWSSRYFDVRWWRVTPTGVCDGGMWFFGAEYDPATGRVVSIEFDS